MEGSLTGPSILLSNLRSHLHFTPSSSIIAYRHSLLAIICDFIIIWPIPAVFMVMEVKEGIKWIISTIRTANCLLKM